MSRSSKENKIVIQYEPFQQGEQSATQAPAQAPAVQQTVHMDDHQHKEPSVSEAGKATSSKQDDKIGIGSWYATTSNASYSNMPNMTQFLTGDNEKPEEQMEPHQQEAQKAPENLKQEVKQDEFPIAHDKPNTTETSSHASTTAKPPISRHVISSPDEKEGAAVPYESQAKQARHALPYQAKTGTKEFNNSEDFEDWE